MFIQLPESNGDGELEAGVIGTPSSDIDDELFLHSKCSL